MWYGFIYYLILFIIFTLFFLFSLKQTYVNSLIALSLNAFCLKNLLSFFLFSFLINFWLIYQILEDSTVFHFIWSRPGLVIFENLNPNSFFSLIHPDTSLLQVYYFPFIYIFVFVTFLSIFFCLSYNFNEFNLFMLYCIIILLMFIYLNILLKW